MPPRKESAPAPHAAAVAASKTSQTLKIAQKAILKSRIAKRESNVAIAKAERQETAAKKRVATAKAEQDRVLNEAFAHYRREHIKNGKGVKHSVKWIADKYACSYFRLWRAVHDRRSVAAVRRGRPPKLTQADLIVANKFIQEADDDDDNFQWSEVCGKLEAIAAGRGTPYISGGRPGIGRRQLGRIRKRARDDADAVIGVGVATDIKRTMSSSHVAAIEEFYYGLADGILKDHPCLLLEPVRWADFDESDIPGREEKSAKKKKVVTTKKNLRRKSAIRGAKARLRHRVLQAGSGKLSGGFTLGGDGAVVCESYIIAGKTVSTSILAPNDDRSDFLPGIPHNAFVNNPAVKVYATAKGVMTRALLSQIIREQIIPLMRKKVPEGPLVLLMDNPKSHKPDLQLLKTLQDEHDFYIIYLPPCCTHLMQPLDLQWFERLKAMFDAVLTNICTVQKSANAYLDANMEVAYKRQKL
jgi:hypothetical protein